jgi:hypothetical protein
VRAWPKGWAVAFQATYTGSIPVARSSKMPGAAGVAQLVERQFCKLDVVGSIPSPGSRFSVVCRRNLLEKVTTVRPLRIPTARSPAEATYCQSKHEELRRSMDNPGKHLCKRGLSGPLGSVRLDSDRKCPRLPSVLTRGSRHPQMTRRPWKVYLNRLFGIMPWTPLLPSTSWVMAKSTPVLVSI